MQLGAEGNTIQASSSQGDYLQIQAAARGEMLAFGSSPNGSRYPSSALPEVRKVICAWGDASCPRSTVLERPFPWRDDIVYVCVYVCVFCSP